MMEQTQPIVNNFLNFNLRLRKQNKSQTGNSPLNKCRTSAFKLEKLDCVILQNNENDMKNVNTKSCWASQFGKSMFEVFLRVTLFVIFIQLERTPAFKRKIQPEELWLYKYPPTNDYVPAAYLMPASFIVPFIVILINYLITHDRHDFTQGNNAVTLALALNGILTSLIKITVGRPRPDYYYRCFPHGLDHDFEMECTGDSRIINEGRKSFPSGHSSFAFAGFGFIFLYLAAKLHVFNERGRGQTIRLCIALFPLIIAALVAISRTCDYHHHWQDVVIGSVLGMSVTYMCYRQYYPSIFSINPQKPFTNLSTINCKENYFEPTVAGNSTNNDLNGELNSLIDEEDKDTKWI